MTSLIRVVEQRTRFAAAPDRHHQRVRDGQWPWRPHSRKRRGGDN